MKDALRRQFDRLLGLLIPPIMTFVSAPVSAHEEGTAQHLAPPSSPDSNFILTNPLNRDSENLYAGHRSHSSHSSHASHASHASGSGGYSSPGTYSSPSYESTTPKRAEPTPPNDNYYDPSKSNASPARREFAPKNASPSGDELTLLIMRVQIALKHQGYEPGAIDGVLSSQTKEAIKNFQLEQKLPQTGTMTTETLNALGVKL